MTNSEPAQPYVVGSVVNGHVWTGTEWLPIAQPTVPKSQSPWRTVAGIVCLIVGALAGLQSLSWLAGFVSLEEQGNQFAGFLALLGMGGGAVAVGFGVAGIVLLTKKS